MKFHSQKGHPLTQNEVLGPGDPVVDLIIIVILLKMKIKMLYQTSRKKSGTSWKVFKQRTIQTFFVLRTNLRRTCRATPDSSDKF